MEHIDSIVAKIQKLLNLANSDNENEAKSAASKASALLMKHNLELQQIKDKNFEYGSMEATEAKQIKWHHKYIIDLVSDYFFVQVTIRVSWCDKEQRRRRTIQLIGTNSNCRVASYIFAYLNDIYPKLWWAYKDAPERRHMGLRKQHRDSYFKGLSLGISKVLDETKFRVQNETGLVLKEDLDLKKFVEELTKGSKHCGGKVPEFHPEIAKQGYEDGLKVQLKKPIETERNLDEVLFLN